MRKEGEGDDGEKKREGKKGKKQRRSRGVDRRVKETSPGKQRTNGNWFACRYAGKNRTD
jgi:hypothetical protein